MIAGESLISMLLRPRPSWSIVGPAAFGLVILLFLVDLLAWLTPTLPPAVPSQAPLAMAAPGLLGLLLIGAGLGSARRTPIFRPFLIALGAGAFAGGHFAILGFFSPSVEVAVAETVPFAMIVPRIVQHDWYLVRGSVPRARSFALLC